MGPMPVLVLVNGPPASGKSTIAARLVAVRPLALDLDIDVVRGLLGAWLDDPTTAGRAARALALSMAQTHLSAGHDVVVPQFLGRIEFITELESVAAQTGARFVEIGLVVDRQTASVAFHARRAAPETSARADAAALVERSTSGAPVGEMYHSYVELVNRRPHAHRIVVIRGDIDGARSQPSSRSSLDAIPTAAGPPQLWDTPSS